MARTWYGHFDSVEDDSRMLMAEDWASYIRSFITNGIFNGGTNLQVSPGGAMRVRVDLGRANIEGYIFIVEEDAGGRFYEVEIPPPNPVNTRIDRVVLRLDRSLAARRISIEVLQGDAGTNPQPRGLTRDNIIWELSLAQVRVAARAPSITAANITDERFNTQLCGLVNSVLGLDPSAWQNQFDEFFSAFVANTSERDEEFLREQWEKFTNQINEQQVIFQGLHKEMKLLFQAQEALTFTRINNNFDDISARRGCDRVTVFNSDGSITETIRVVALDFVLATRRTFFNGDSIDEIITFNPWEFIDGNVISVTTAFEMVRSTFFETDGNIREEVR